jgi:hypothetical protein
VQVELPLEVMVTAVADTAPVELVEPVAATQSPTATLEEVVVLSWVTLAEVPMTTV